MTTAELVELSRLSGVAFRPSPDDPEVVKVIRRRPDLVMTCLRRFLGAEKRLLTFKVFSHHLSVRQVVHSIIKQADIAVMFVRRRPIDMYISSRKAIQLQRGQDVDATDARISIDADMFLRWWSGRVIWYRRLERNCWHHGKKFDRLHEADIELPPDELARSLCARLARHGVAGLTVPGIGKIASAIREGHAHDLARTVDNWPEFENALRARGALKAAFEPIPGYDPTLWQRMRHWFAF